MTFSGIHNDEPFSISVPLSEDIVVQSDSVLETSWVGKQIEELESGPRSNSAINEIVDLSKSYRVLSEYIAFLALEPSDTTKACASCVDESQIPIGIEPEELPAADSLLSVYPNPFTTAATIEVTVPREIGAGSAAVVIYDVMGRKIRRFDVQAPGGSVQKLTWDGTAADNSRVAAGGVFRRAANRTGHAYGACCSAVGRRLSTGPWPAS